MRQMPTAPSGLQDPLSEYFGEVTLQLLATGLVEWYEVRLGQLRSSPEAPFPDALQRGANRLAAMLLWQGLAAPGGLAQLISFCHQPLASWPVSLPDAMRFGQLLAANRPTSICYELAIEGGNAEHELVARKLPVIMSRCRQFGRPEWYSLIRQWLIEHPVMHGAAFAVLRDPYRTPLEATQQEWIQMYEAVPKNLIRDGKVYLCRHCGWTLQWLPNGTAQCGDEQCSSVVGDPMSPALYTPYGEGLLRLRAPLRRYLVLPGLAEVTLGQWLEANEGKVTYWPDYDAYDLHVDCPGRNALAIDVKDWSSPFSLARAIREGHQPQLVHATRFLYVVPDHRNQSLTGYLQAVHSKLASDSRFVPPKRFWGQPPQLDRYTVVTTAQLKRQVRQFGKGEKPDAAIRPVV